MRSWMVIAAAAAISVGAAGCGGDSSTDSASTTTSAADSSSTTATTEVTTITAAPVVADAPTVISLPIPFAEQNNDIVIVPTDVGQHAVNGVDDERGIYDRGNWRIVAQCDQMVDGRLTVGAIKADEFTAISQAGQGSSLADNSLASFLDCP